MPTYEYECQSCGHRFEVFQSMKDAPLSICERCGGAVKRLISPGAGFLFKGSGFYLTDYRSAGYKKRAKEDSGGAAGGAKDGGAKEGGAARKDKAGEGGGASKGKDGG